MFLVSSVLLVACLTSGSSDAPPALATPEALSAPLAPSLVPTATKEPGTYIFQKLEAQPGLTFYNQSGKTVALREEVLKAFMNMVHAEASLKWPVEIVIVSQQETLIEIKQHAEGSTVVTTFNVAAEDERSLNAGLTAALGLIRPSTMDPNYLLSYAYTAEDMGLMNASILSNMTYQEYVTWTLDEKRIPLTGDTGVSMEEKWDQFKKEFTEAGVTKLLMFLP
jgi:hypothetical protein